jgi:hypothetical protein
MTTNDTNIAALRHIVSRARDVLRTTEPPPASLATHLPLSLQTMAHTLPNPQPITSILIAEGIHPPMAEKLSQLYLLHAGSLKNACEKQMHAAALHWIRTTGITRQQGAIPTQLAAVHSKYHDHYLKTLRSHRDALISKCHERVVALQSPKRERSEDSDLGLQAKSSFKVSLYHDVFKAYV